MRFLPVSASKQFCTLLLNLSVCRLGYDLKQERHVFLFSFLLMKMFVDYYKDSETHRQTDKDPPSYLVAVLSSRPGCHLAIKGKK